MTTRPPDQAPRRSHGVVKLLRRLVLVAAAVLILGIVAAGTAYALLIADPGFLTADSRREHAQKMASGLQLVTPPGPGPFPTVLLIHGCGGLHAADRPNPIMDEYARSAVEAGWAAGILDSYAPRGWAAPWARLRVCTGLRLPGFVRASDLLAGLDLLAADPRVDRRRLRIASWSHGGWALGDLMAIRDPGDGSLRRTLADVEAVMFTYPFCGFPAQGSKRPWTWRGDVRAVFAENDTVQDKAGCLPMLERAREGGSTVETVVFPGVTHAFDERVKSADSTFRFDPAATEKAHAGFVAWLEAPRPGPR